MIDVRNAISNILDRYTLGEVVEVTLRKMKRDHAILPFAPEAAEPERSGRRVLDPAQGFLSQLALPSLAGDEGAPLPPEE
jgi:hypothetical protein